MQQGEHLAFVVRKWHYARLCFLLSAALTPCSISIPTCSERNIGRLSSAATALEVPISANLHEVAMPPLRDRKQGDTSEVDNPDLADELTAYASEASPSARARGELEKLFQSHRDAMLDEAHRILRDPDDADDVLQRIFMRLLAGWDSYEKKKITRFYLVRASRNEAISMARRRRPEEPLAPAVVWSIADPQRDQLERLTRAEQRHLLDRWIETLPKRCREVVSLVVCHHKKYWEVANTLGITVKAVEKQMARAYRLARRAAVGGRQITAKPDGVQKRGRGGGRGYSLLR